jgi:hypothetical protein
VSLLSHINTSIGRIELQHENGRFTTRRAYTSCVDQTERVCIILISRESALEWYELAERNGAVHAVFPEEVSLRG